MVSPVNVDVGGIFQGAFNLIDELWTSDEERQAAKLKVMELHQRGQLAQIAVNTQEAKSKSLFVAGWRPAAGWACVAAMAWTFLIQPFVVFIAVVLGQYIDVPFDASQLPVLDTVTMMPVLMGMLGMGAMRSRDKQLGVER